MKPLIAAVLLSVAAQAMAQETCARSGVCGGTFNDQMTFESGACLDGETRRYEYFVFTPSVGATITATAQSAFFAPAIEIINGNNAVVASDENPGKRSSARASTQVNSGGSWTVRVRNIDIATGGPYSLTIECSTPPPPNGFALGVSPVTLTLGRNETGSVRVTSTGAGSFSEDVAVTMFGLPAGVTVNPATFTFPKPGVGSETVQIITTDSASAGAFSVAAEGRSTSGLISIAAATLIIDAPCTPPSIAHQPSNVSAIRGSTARLVISPSGSPPFTIQWYRGFSPSTFFPIAGATSIEYQTDALQNDSQFWVRLSNACGSRDSNTINVKTTAAPTRRRAAGH
jgi:hypothetical protein